jgi:hypothetical protein
LIPASAAKKAFCETLLFPEIRISKFVVLKLLTPTRVATISRSKAKTRTAP